MHKLSRPVNKITGVPYIKDDLTAGYALDELLPYVVPFRISLFDHGPGRIMAWQRSPGSGLYFAPMRLCILHVLCEESGFQSNASEGCPR